MRAALPAAVVMALFSASAAAAPYATVEHRVTTTRAGSPTGVAYNATYHAANRRDGRPPFMRRMVVYPPKGMRYDTSVPDRCTASDAELALRGANACPRGSLLGGGTVEGLFLFPFNDNATFHEYWHTVDIMNNANEQIVLINAEGSAVVRGRIQPDNSVEFNTPTCFPSVEGVPCADDYMVQLKTNTLQAAYTRGGRSYATTPPACPRSGYWKWKARFWWSDGTVETVATKNRCRRASRHK